MFSNDLHLSRRPKRAPRIAAAALLTCVLAWPSPVLSQTPAPPPSPTVSSRSLTVEAIIVVVMVGAVLFAICRSSRRN